MGFLNWSSNKVNNRLNFIRQNSVKKCATGTQKEPKIVKKLIIQIHKKKRFEIYILANMIKVAAISFEKEQNK